MADMDTPYTAALMIAGVLAIVAGGALLVAAFRRPAPRPPARRPDPGLRPAVAGRVYQSSRAGGVASARDAGRVATPRAASVATLPPVRPAWTVSVSHHAQVRAGRHRVPAGVSR